MIEILHFDLSVVLFSIDIQWESLVIKQSQLLIVFLLHIHVIEADISATELVRKLVFHQMVSTEKVREIDVTSDADGAGCLESRKPTTGYGVQAAGSLEVDLESSHLSPLLDHESFA